jgi:HEAT repeat protein
MRTRLAASVLAALLAASVAAPARVRASQPTFEETVAQLSSQDTGARLKAVQLLKAAAYPEAAVPLAAVVRDPDDAVQFEAIAAELNIFLAEKIVPRKRIGLVIEVRNNVAAEAAFVAGPLALGAAPVPATVLDALRAVWRDENPRVGLEALYAFGTLAVQAGGTGRRDLLHAAGPELAGLLGAPDPATRDAAARVLGRVFERRPGDAAIETHVGDGLITALNDGDRAVRSAAMVALGAMRYERAVQALTELHQYYRHGELAEASLDALARIANPASAPLFAAALTGKDAALRRIAIEGFARLGDRARAQAIETAVGAQDREPLRAAAAFASTALAQAPVDSLLAMLTRPAIRDQVRGYLVELARGHVDRFVQAAQDPDARLRADVCDVLGLAGDPAARRLLEPLANDADPAVALAARRALVRL